MLDKYIREAVALLDDDGLVWSDDFESVRLPLADLLEKLRQTPSHQFDDEIETLVFALLQADITGITAPDPLQEWVESATRQLGIVEVTASRSQRTADAIKRLFGSL